MSKVNLFLWHLLECYLRVQIQLIIMSNSDCMLCQKLFQFFFYFPSLFLRFVEQSFYLLVCPLKIIVRYENVHDQVMRNSLINLIKRDSCWFGIINKKIWNVSRSECPFIFCVIKLMKATKTKPIRTIYRIGYCNVRRMSRKESIFQSENRTTFCVISFHLNFISGTNYNLDYHKLLYSFQFWIASAIESPLQKFNMIQICGIRYVWHWIAPTLLNVMFNYFHHYYDHRNHAAWSIWLK